MNIIELNQQCRELQEMLLDGEIPAEAVKDTLEGLKGEITERFDWLSNIKRDYQLHQEGLKLEIARLQEKLEKIEKAESKLTTYIIDMLKSYFYTNPNEKSVQTAHYKLSVKHTQQTIVNDEESFIKYAKEHGLEDCINEKTEIKVTTKPDRKAIKARLDAGTDMNGLAMIQDNYSLIMK